MGVESAVDRRTFVSADDFGVSVTHTPAGGSPLPPFDAIYDAPVASTELDGGVSVQGSAPMLTVADDDVTTPINRDDQIDVPGEGTFVVVTVEPDGTGMLEVKLSV